jgi:hypothetical protein
VCKGHVAAVTLSPHMEVVVGAAHPSLKRGKNGWLSVALVFIELCRVFLSYPGTCPGVQNKSGKKNGHSLRKRAGPLQ